MGGRIPDEIIQQVLDRTDIVDLIGGYLPLRPAGSRWKALCPFHTEKTPSFMVNPERQIFHCFGCGKGGSALTFLMEHERLAFPEALRFLADRAGVRLPAVRADGREGDGRLRLLEAHRQAAEHFRANLAGPAGAAARAHLEGRGVDAGTAERFQLGYALPQWDGLLRHLVRAGFRPEEVERAGLASPRREPAGGAGRGGVYDRFRERLMIPIADASGKVIAFGGRALKAEDVKYMNSPETPLYRKGEHLYGLSLAARPIREAGWAILVEGYFDCIALHRAGYANAVASLGTALTPRQVELLARYTDRVVLAFDPDRAGLQAALRGIEVLLGRGLGVEVAAMPEGLDPDTLVGQRGREGVAEVLSHTLDVVDFAWAMASRAAAARPGPGGSRPDGVDAAVRAGEAILGLLGRMEPGLRRDKYVQRLAERLGLSEARVQAELRRRAARPGAHGRAAGAAPPAAEDPRPALPVEGKLLQFLLWHPERLGEALAVVAPEDFADPAFRKIFALACEGAARGGPPLPRVLADHPEGEIGAVARTLLMADGREFADDPDRVLRDYLRTIRGRRDRRERERIARQMKAAEAAGDAQAMERLKAEHPAWRPARRVP